MSRAIKASCSTWPVTRVFFLQRKTKYYYFSYWCQKTWMPSAGLSGRLSSRDNIEKVLFALWRLHPTIFEPSAKKTKSCARSQASECRQFPQITACSVREQTQIDRDTEPACLSPATKNKREGINGLQTHPFSAPLNFQDLYLEGLLAEASSCSSPSAELNSYWLTRCWSWPVPPGRG